MALVFELLAKRRHAEAADILALLLKALGRCVVNSAWVRGRYLELRPSEDATLLYEDEDLMLVKGVRADAELRTGSS